MAFQQGLSGLNVSSRALDVISNNVANASTVGFKAATTIFADIYNSAFTGVNSAIQVGIGAKVAAVYQNFNDGLTTTTNNPLDMAIIGNGFYVIQRTDGTIGYSRNGQFDINKDGYIITPLGERLLGVRSIRVGDQDIIPQSGGNIEPLFVDKSVQNPAATTKMEIRSGNLNADDNAIPSNPVDISNVRVTMPYGYSYTNPTSNLTAGGWSVTLTFNAGVWTLDPPVGYNLDTSTPPAARLENIGTGEWLQVDVGAVTPANGDRITVVVPAAKAFDPTDLDSYNLLNTIAVFDSLGGEHSLQTYFKKTSPGTWEVYTMLDGDLSTLSPAPINPLKFDAFGKLVSSGQFSYTASLTNSAATMNIDIDLSRMTQFGAASSVTDHAQNGYTVGQIAGIVINADGVIQGRYTNGQSKNLGQVVLATFRSNQGLTSLGDNLWAESPDSGPPIIGRPRTGLNGTISGGQVEESNVDLTQELVNMIIQQRNYQANAQTIRTQDQILQTLVNLR